MPAEKTILNSFNEMFSRIPNLKVVIIDMLGSSSLMDSIWNYNYFKEGKIMHHLHLLALKRNIAIIVVHHSPKRRSDDFLDNVSGTIGTIGPGVSTWVMDVNRSTGICTLRISGRYQKQKSFQLEFDEDLGELKYTGDKIEIELTPDWKKIYKVFLKYPDKEELASRFIAQELSKSQSNISNTIKRMKKKGIVVNGSKRGFYKLAQPPSKEDLVN
jgi:biotin operon repressor